MVKTFSVDCEYLVERSSAHDYLARVLELPPYYGRNLDALYDCVTGLGPCRIILTGTEVLRQWGGYGARILDALEAGAAENPNIQLIYCPPAEE